MTQRQALIALFCIGMFGVAFSGTLTYQELFGASAVSCPSPGKPGTIFGYPACVYGLLMYIAIVVIAGLGLRSQKK